MKRYVIYARVSSPHQATEEKESIPEQLESGKKLIERLGETLVEIYVDPGYQSWRRDRPSFKRMIADGKAGRFDVIVAWKADRLVGSAATCGDLEELIDKGIELVGVVEPIDKNLILAHALFKKWETKAKSDRSRMGGIGRAKKGLPQGGAPPYGCRYNKETQQLEIEEAEAVYYRRMFEWCITGWGDMKVAAYLNKLGVPTKRGSSKGWEARRVGKLLTNTIAYGEGYYRAKGTDPIPISYPAIIDKATFELAQQARQKRRNFGARVTNRVYLLRHKRPVCVECGHSFYIKSRSLTVRSRGKVYTRRTNGAWLICRGQYLYPHLYECRKPAHINYDAVEQLVVKCFNCLFTDEDFGFLRRYIVAQEADELPSVNTRIKEVKDRLQATKMEMSFVTTKARQGVMPEDIYDLQMAALRGRAEYHQEELEKLEAQAVTQATKKQKAEDIEKVVQQWRKWARVYWHYPAILNQLPEETLEQLAKVIEYLTDEIGIDRSGKVKVKLNLPVIAKIYNYYDSVQQAYTAPSQE